jgi:hypothetical protein
MRLTRKGIQFTTICISLLLFFGCARPTVQQFKQKPGGKDTFEINLPSEVTYQKILIGAREKYQYGSIPVTGDFWQSSKQGCISYVFSGYCKTIYFVIEVEPINENRTRITTYHLRDSFWEGNWKKVTTEARRWLGNPVTRNR